MKKLLLSSFCVAGLALASPVSGAQLVPSVFASAFCASMDAGIGRDDSLRFAVKMSLDRTKPPAIKVGDTDLDVRASLYAAQIKCAQHFSGGWQ